MTVGYMTESDRIAKMAATSKDALLVAKLLGYQTVSMRQHDEVWVIGPHKIGPWLDEDLWNDLVKAGKRLADLEKRDAMLSALEAGGVDNWEWYSESLREFYEELNDSA